MHQPSKTVGILAVTQIVSWGSLFYAFSIVAPDIQRDLGLGPELVFGAFSWALLAAGLVATPVGIMLDRYGGRYVMAAGSLLSFLGLVWLSRCEGVVFAGEQHDPLRQLAGRIEHLGQLVLPGGDHPVHRVVGHG